MADYLTAQELVDKLEVSLSTINRMLKRQQLKEGVDIYRVGRKIRVLKPVMAEFPDQRIGCRSARKGQEKAPQQGGALC